MRFTIITIFPQFFQSPLQHGLLEKAIEKQAVAVEVINLRDFADPPHHRTDDYAYGGGPGMVMTPAPLARAIAEARKRDPESRVISLSPGGRPLTDPVARELAEGGRGLILICGRYEGIDQRIVDHYCDGELSIGDFVLTGGEPAALVVIDAVSRMLPGVIGDPESVDRDSFTEALAHPQYTRPPEFEGHPVPEVLLSGNHEKIDAWRKEAALSRTVGSRPDLAGPLARKRIWVVCPNVSDPEALLTICRLLSVLQLGGAVFVDRDASIRKEIRETVDPWLCAMSSTGPDILPQIRVKGSLKEALSAIERREQSRPIVLSPLVSDPQWKGAPTHLAARPAVLVFGPVSPEEREAFSILGISPGPEASALPYGTQIPILVERLLKCRA